MEFLLLDSKYTIVSADPKSESRLPMIKSLEIYVPRDERFNQLKMSDFAAYALKLLSQFLLAELEASNFTEFDTFEDELKIYDDGFKFPFESLVHKIRDHVPMELVKELLRSDGEHLCKFPMPQVIKGKKKQNHFPYFSLIIKQHVLFDFILMLYFELMLFYLP